MPKLVINPGTPQAREFELKPGANYVGRGFANDLKIEDASISSSHAEITVNGGSVVVKDLGSTNGTFVNRAPVKEAALLPGQSLRLGGLEMLFESDATGAPVARTESAVSVPAVPVAGGLRIATSSPAQPAAAASTPVAGGLRIAGLRPAATAAEPPPPPIQSAESAPPIAPPLIAPTQTAATGAPKKAVCKFHPKSPSRWLCSKCGQQYCDLCVGIRKTNEGSAHVCRPCGVVCSPISIDVHINAGSPGNFYKMVPSAFAYPFKNDGILILIVGTAIVGLLRLASHFPMLPYLLGGSALGYSFAYMQNVIMTTIGGDERKPDLPDTDDLRGQAGLLVLTILCCFGPAIGLLYWSTQEGWESVRLYILPAVILGCFYFPMAFLGVAVFSSVAAVNPTLVVPSMLRVPLQYILTCIFLGLVLLVSTIGEGMLNLLIPIPFVPDVIAGFVGLYFLTVQSRILGLLYYCNHHRLGWVKL